MFDSAGSLTNRYLHGDEVDQVFADENAVGDVLWPLADHQHTVRDLAEYDAGTDMTTVANHRTFDSFGNVTAETNAAVDHLFAYTGREWDADAELLNYRTRWYDPQAGRFVSEDPLGFNGGDMNLVRYVTNSPWNFTDPSGLNAISPIVQTAAQIVAPTATNFVNTVTAWSGAVRNWSGGNGGNAPGYSDDGLNHAYDLAGGGDDIALQAAVDQYIQQRVAAEVESYNALEYFRRTGSPIEQRPGETPLETLQRHVYEQRLEAWRSATLMPPMTFEEYVATHVPNPYELERQGTPSIRALTPAEAAEFDRQTKIARLKAKYYQGPPIHNFELLDRVRRDQGLIGTFLMPRDGGLDMIAGVGGGFVGVPGLSGGSSSPRYAARPQTAGGRSTPPTSKPRVSGRNPPISSRQRLHTDGTPGKSQFNRGIDVEGVVRMAWEAGEKVFDTHGKFIGKRFTFNTPIGTSQNGYSQHSIFVHWSPRHGIHGVPTTVGTTP